MSGKTDDNRIGLQFDYDFINLIMIGKGLRKFHTVLQNLSGSYIFSVQDLCTMALRSLRFSSQFLKIDNQEQGLR